MLNSIDFSALTQWTAIATVVFLLLTVISFIAKWGIKFRLVGTTGFMMVLTVGLFGLSLGLFKNVQVPGSVAYSVAYDNGGNTTVISVAPTITAPELEATLNQAANRLFSFGRISANSELIIRARALIHPSEGISKPVYIGTIKKIPNQPTPQLEIYPDQLALLK